MMRNPYKDRAARGGFVETPLPHREVPEFRPADSRTGLLFETAETPKRVGNPSNHGAFSMARRLLFDPAIRCRYTSLEP